MCKIKNLPVAQLDNATDSDSVDRGFESRRADHTNSVEKSTEFVIKYSYRNIKTLRL